MGNVIATKHRHIQGGHTMESIAFDIENRSVFFENSIFSKRYQIGGILKNATPTRCKAFLSWL